MKNQKLKGNLIMLVVSVIFGLNFTISKMVLSTGLMEPRALTMARVLFACSAFWITSLFLPRERVALKDKLMLLLGSFCAITLNQGLFVFGLAKTSPIDASIVCTSTPMLAMLLAAFILKEPITFKKVSGVLIGAAGALILITTAQYQDARASSLSGNLIIFASSCIYTIYLVVIKPVVEKYSAITVMKWMFLFALIVNTPFMAKALITAPIFAQSEVEPFLCLLFVVFCATFITYMLIPMAQKLIRPTTIGMYNYVQPLVATITAVVIGQDALTPVKLLSATLIFVGVYLVTISKSRKQVLEERQRQAAAAACDDENRGVG